MIDSNLDVYEDLERTQPLPMLSAEVGLDEALQRERAARIQVVELMRQNAQQALELEVLRSRNCEDLEGHQPVVAGRHATTEERLFEVCGSLRDTLSRVLRECRTRHLALHCEDGARRAFEHCCDKLELILSAPGFVTPADPAQVTVPVSFLNTAEPGFRSMRAITLEGLASADELRAGRFPRLAIVRSEAKY